MFERYTEHARRVIFFARYEASQLGSNYVTPEHMLLGYFRENTPALTKLLDAAAVSAISEEIRTGKTDRKVATSVDLPLSNSGKRVLAYAAEEAERAGDPKVRSEYLFMGILRERSCEAAQLLEKFGVTIESARDWAHAIRDAEDEKKDSETINPQWVSLGLPVGYACPLVTFNASSGMLVLEIRSKGRAMPSSRLFARHKDASQYQPILVEDDDPVSCESAVTAPNQPILAFNTMLCEKRPAERSKGIIAHGWRAVEIFDLSTLSRIRSIARSDLSFPSPYQDCWISCLLSLSVDGKILYSRVALTRKVQSVGSVSTVEYHLAALDLSSLKLEPITELPGTFF